MSGIARLFVSTYSTKMRGGYLRFQAQYLRRIHIPHWDNVGPVLRDELIAAALAKDLAACNRAVFELYNFSEAERAAGYPHSYCTGITRIFQSHQEMGSDCRVRGSVGAGDGV